MEFSIICSLQIQQWGVLNLQIICASDWFLFHSNRDRGEWILKYLDPPGYTEGNKLISLEIIIEIIRTGGHNINLLDHNIIQMSPVCLCKETFRNEMKTEKPSAPPSSKLYKYSSVSWFLLNFYVQVQL